MKLRVQPPSVWARLQNTAEGRPAHRAVTLVEMMVTMALLTVIILGLVAMFDQTRKAFTSGLGTVDYQDSGRVALDMLARDLEQMTPANTGLLFFTPANTSVNYNDLWVTNYSGVFLTNALNFYVDVEPSFKTSPYQVWQAATGDLATPTMDRVFFVTRYNQSWNAIGYKVDPATAGPNGLGTLYQYRASGPSTGGSSPVDTVLNDFLSQTNTALSPGPLNRVIDNVINFRVRAYDPNGVPIVYSTNEYVATNTGTLAGADLGYTYVLTNRAIPAYVELEVSILETRTADRYRSMAGNNALSYLTNHLGQVHVYRQRVTIPGVDSSAYP